MIYLCIRSKDIALLIQQLTKNLQTASYYFAPGQKQMCLWNVKITIYEEIILDFQTEPYLTK